MISFPVWILSVIRRCKKSLPKVLDFLKDGPLFLVVFLTLFLLLMLRIVRYSGLFVDYQQVLRAPDRFWRSVVMVYCAFGMVSFVLFWSLFRLARSRPQHRRSLNVIGRGLSGPWYLWGSISLWKSWQTRLLPPGKEAGTAVLSTRHSSNLTIWRSGMCSLFDQSKRASILMPSWLSVMDYSFLKIFLATIKILRVTSGGLRTI